MKRSLYLSIVLGLALAAAASAACSTPPSSSGPAAKDDDVTAPAGGKSDEGSETEPPSAKGAKAECLPYTEPVTGQGESAPNAAGEYIEFDDYDLYTGFDGEHKFEIPTVVTFRREGTGERDAKLPFPTPPTITVEDPSILDVRTAAKPTWADDDDVGQYLMMTAKKAGVTKVTAKHGEHSVYTVVHVQAYTPEQFNLGKQRYEKPANPNKNRQACTTCHDSTTGAMNDDDTISHDPTELSWYPDEEIRVIATEGQTCEEGKKTPIIELTRFGSHQWHFTQEELVGIVAYMRSLKPLGF